MLSGSFCNSEQQYDEMKPTTFYVKFYLEKTVTRTNKPKQYVVLTNVTTINVMLMCIAGCELGHQQALMITMMYSSTTLSNLHTFLLSSTQFLFLSISIKCAAVLGVRGMSRTISRIMSRNISSSVSLNIFLNMSSTMSMNMSSTMSMNMSRTMRHSHLTLASSLLYID